jgi:hypothetical protein
MRKMRNPMTKYKDLPKLPVGIPIELGRIVATPGALHALSANQVSPLRYLERHRKGDWGQIDANDWRANNEAVVTFNRVLSQYDLEDKARIWIITEWDRSVTTILLPEEY